MSSLLSGIGKIFTSFGGGTGGATIGAAVRGVGASLFTAGAATGASASGGGLASLFGGGGGVLSNMFNGVARILGGGAGGVAGTAAGATGLGSVLGATPAVGATSAAGLAAEAGPWGAAANIGQGLGAGLFPAATPTGFAAAGASAGTAPGGGLLSAAGGLLNSPLVASALEGYGKYAEAEMKSENDRLLQGDLINEKQRAEAQLRSNYEVPASAYAGGSGDIVDRTPRVTPQKRWAYVEGQGIQQV